jgi:hypothetical protein
MAPNTVKARFDWLTYNEPESHLDHLVDRLCRLPGMNHGARIVGLTYKDDSTLHRFNRLGYSNTYRYDARADFALQDPNAGLETIQAVLDTTTASRLAATHGVADLLLVRHVLEHAHDPAAFLLTLCKLVKRGGYLLFEMPDCTKFIKACDYSFIWEEHITYFSSPTLAAFLNKANLVLQETFVFPYPLEDSLIGLVRNQAPTSAARLPSKPPVGCVADGAVFSQGYPRFCARIQSLLRGWKRRGKRIAIFGAGHLAVKFVNMYALGELIDCAIDDHPRKQALLMPGSRLPIRGSDALADVDICLLALNAESARKVASRHRSFLERGGQFLSIFVLSPNSVYRLCAP